GLIGAKQAVALPVLARTAIQVLVLEEGPGIEFTGQPFNEVGNVGKRGVERFDFHEILLLAGLARDCLASEGNDPSRQSHFLSVRNFFATPLENHASSRRAPPDPAQDPAA